MDKRFKKQRNIMIFKLILSLKNEKIKDFRFIIFKIFLKKIMVVKNCHYFKIN